MKTEEKHNLLDEVIRARGEEDVLKEERLEKFSPLLFVLGIFLLPFVLAWKIIRFLWLVALSIILGIVQTIVAFYYSTR